MADSTGPDPKAADMKDNLDSTILASLYQVISSRRLGYDTLMWQVPVLSLTAQAFLFTIAPGSSALASRFISSFLALVIALISMQLMSKHRHHELMDSKLLEQLEEKTLALGRFYPYPFSIGPHARSKLREEAVGVKANRFVKASSYKIWMFGLALFAIAAIGIMVITFLSPGVLNR
jgi:hypothetical protein